MSTSRFLFKTKILELVYVFHAVLLLYFLWASSFVENLSVILLVLGKSLIVLQYSQ